MWGVHWQQAERDWLGVEVGHSACTGCTRTAVVEQKAMERVKVSTSKQVSQHTSLHFHLHRALKPLTMKGMIA